MFFWKKQGKWHEVRWFNASRDIYLALQFAADDEVAEEKPIAPKVERLSSKDPVANAKQPPLDQDQLIAEVKSVVEEYNRKNRFHLKVAGIRYRPKGGADIADHGSAARKLLNLL